MNKVPGVYILGGGVGGGGARSCPQAPVILIPSRIGTNDSSAVNFKNLEQGFIKIIFIAFCFLDDIWYSKEKCEFKISWIWPLKRTLISICRRGSFYSIFLFFYQTYLLIRFSILKFQTSRNILCSIKLKLLGPFGRARKNTARCWKGPKKLRLILCYINRFFLPLDFRLH